MKYILSEAYLKSITVFSTILLFCSMLLNSCNPDGSQEQAARVSTKQISTIAPKFEPDSAWLYTKIQVDFGPRSMNSKSHSQCANFLIEKAKLYADTVIVQQTQVKQWDKKMVDIQNIIVSFSPEKTNRVLLCSHWDSRNWADQDSLRKDEPVDGANDGAAGVGVLLEIARLMKTTKPEVGVDIIFLDAEDQGKSDSEDAWCLGTQYWAANPHVKNYYASYGILLDMIGAKDAIFTQESYSVEYASSVVQKVWEAAGKIGYSDYFVYEKTHPITDDHYYINTVAHIPCIDIIQHDKSTSSRFYKNWHTHQDKLEFIDKNSLRAVGQTLLEVVYNER